MSWCAEKAERGTSAILESLPSLSKEDYHIVMIGLGKGSNYEVLEGILGLEA